MVFSQKMDGWRDCIAYMVRMRRKKCRSIASICYYVLLSIHSSCNLLLITFTLHLFFPRWGMINGLRSTGTERERRYGNIFEKRNRLNHFFAHQMISVIWIRKRPFTSSQCPVCPTLGLGNAGASSRRVTSQIRKQRQFCGRNKGKKDRNSSNTKWSSSLASPKWEARVFNVDEDPGITLRGFTLFTRKGTI